MIFQGARERWWWSWPWRWRFIVFNLVIPLFGNYLIFKPFFSCYSFIAFGIILILYMLLIFVIIYADFGCLFLALCIMQRLDQHCWFCEFCLWIPQQLSFVRSEKLWWLCFTILLVFYFTNQQPPITYCLIALIIQLTRWLVGGFAISYSSIYLYSCLRFGRMNFLMDRYVGCLRYINVNTIFYLLLIYVLVSSSIY